MTDRRRPHRTGYGRVLQLRNTLVQVLHQMEGEGLYGRPDSTASDIYGVFEQRWTGEQAIYVTHTDILKTQFVVGLHEIHAQYEREQVTWQRYDDDTRQCQSVST